MNKPCLVRYFGLSWIKALASLIDCVNDFDQTRAIPLWQYPTYPKLCVCNMLVAVVRSDIKTFTHARSDIRNTTTSTTTAIVNRSTIPTTALLHSRHHIIYLTVCILSENPYPSHNHQQKQRHSL